MCIRDRFSDVTISLIEEYGFLYDSSLMADDFQPYHPRMGDQVTKDSPLVRGRPSPVWELPMSFEFDDWAHFQFNFDPYRSGHSAPSKVREIWQGEIDWMHANVEGGIATITMHPQVIGRGHRIAMLEQIIIHYLTEGDVSFARMGDVARSLGA